MKKLVCICLMLVMALTGCGKAKHLATESEKTIQHQENEKSGFSDNSTKENIQASPIPIDHLTQTDYFLIKSLLLIIGLTVILVAGSCFHQICCGG